MQARKQKQTGTIGRVLPLCDGSVRKMLSVVCLHAFTSSAMILQKTFGAEGHFMSVCVKEKEVYYYTSFSSQFFFLEELFCVNFSAEG